MNLCDEVTTHVLNPSKLEAARMAGRVTDKEIADATKAPKLSTSLYQVPLADIEDDLEGL